MTVQVPQAARQVKDAPVKALRAVFSGIGQLLLAADKFRAEGEAGYDESGEHHDPLREWHQPDITGVSSLAAGKTGEPAELAAPGKPGERAKGEAPGKPARPAKPARPEKPTRPGKLRRPEKAGRPEKPSPGRRPSGKAADKPATDAIQPGKDKKQAGKGARPAKPGGKNARNRQASEAPGQRRFRSLDSTGNVRVLTPADLAELSGGTEPSKQATPPTTVVSPATAASTPATTPATPVTKASPATADSAAGSKAKEKGIGEGKAVTIDGKPSARRASGSAQAGSVGFAGPVDLPVPGYDDLSIPSLRARLRNLDTTQLQVLLTYERGNAGRQDVITMFERRIAKLGAADAT